MSIEATPASSASKPKVHPAWTTALAALSHGTGLSLQRIVN